MEGKPNDGILESAESGDLSQQAIMYATGKLEAECDDEVFEECRLVDEKGEAKVLYFIGLYYHYGWGTANDLKAAVECYVRAAGVGSFEALERLYSIRSNQLMKANLQDAFKGFCEKADQGNAIAQCNAGYCHYEGIGTPEDNEKARDLFQKAADQGCADAMYMLDRCRERGFEDGYNRMQGIELLKYAAELGSAEAEFELGCAYECGHTTYGLKVGRDYKQGIEWWRKAVDQNHTEATYNLAECYYYGKGVQKNIKKAFEIWKKAALMGYKDAQDCISDFYRQGYFHLSKNDYSIDTDFYEAAYWNRKAVDQNYYNAKESMPDILKSIGLTQDQIDELMIQRSSFESAEIWYNIAKQYETGEGVEKDEQKAFEMYKLAARHRRTGSPCQMLRTRNRC